MKNKYKFLGLLGLLPFLATAQLTNNGATIVIEQGATLVVEGDISNTSGTITNSGTISLKGDFTNAGSIASNSGDGIIIFNGDEDQAFASETDINVSNLVVDNSEDKVSLTGTGDIIIGTNLEFTANAGNLDIGAANLVLPTGANPVVNASADSYIEAASTGKVKKPFSSTGTYTFPIGDATGYSPLEVAVTAGTVGPSAFVGANVVMTETGHPNLPSDASNPSRNTTDFIKRAWDIENEGLGGTFEADVEGTYIAGDIVNDETLIKAAIYDGADWSYDIANTGTLTVGGNVSSNSILTGSNTFGKGMVQVILGGAYDDATNEMRTDLNGGASGILAAEALNSPYGTGESVTAAFFESHQDIVDWVKIELRSSGDNETVVAERSAFVEKDGTLVDIDGNATDEILFFKDAPQNSFIAIKHRNHLGIMLNNTTPLLASAAVVDFTAPGANTFGTDAQQTFDGKLMMYAADVNGDSYVRAKEGSVGFPPVVIPSERDLILNVGLGSDVNGQLTNAYSPFDTNMDGYVRAKEGSVGFPPVVIPSDRDFTLNFPLQGVVNAQKEEQLPEND